KANLETIESLKSKGLESSENVSSELENQSENDCLVVEKECDKEKNPKNVEIKLKRKRRKRKSSKQNVKQVDNDVSRANNDYVHFSDLDTFSSVRRSKNSGVIWKKKRSSNTSNVGLSAVFVSNLNKNVKRYSRKDLKGIGFENPSYFEKAKDLRPTLYDEKVIGLGEENPKVIAPGMFKLNVSQCVSPISMSKLSCDSNNVEIKLKRKRHLDTFSSVRRPRHIDVIWKKKESSNTFNVGETSSAYMCNDDMNVSCDSRMNDLLDDNNFFIFDDVNVRISPVSKIPFRKKPRDSMHVRSKNCPDLSLDHQFGISKHMTGNRALLTIFVEKFLETVRFGNNDFAVIAGYEDVVFGSMTIKKVYYVEGLGHNLFSVGQFSDKGLEVAFRKSTCFVRNEDGVDLLTVQRVRTDNSTEFKNKTLAKFFDEDVGKLKAKGDIGVFVGYSKESAAFRIYNKRTRKIHESVNVNFDEISEMASKQFSLELGLSNLNKTGKSSNQLVSQVSESFQGESSSSSLNDDVQQSPEEVILP
nr:integrase, catalytic region, zinc finger, CCHC-type, peptidase aspartic, catalytic [Tanacetum cinerariifolium]